VLWQVLWERVEGQGTQAVLRFIAPDLRSQGFEATAGDMDWLCASHGLPVAALPTSRSDSIVINVMDRPVARGNIDPDAVQFFQAYEIRDGGCAPLGY
jgi:hypothetical protein